MVFWFSFSVVPKAYWGYLRLFEVGLLGSQILKPFHFKSCFDSCCKSDFEVARPQEFARLLLRQDGKVASKPSRMIDKRQK